jgi:anthranilate synthase/aminodeoxychorismate synthase-like glutamine amidotransferase
MILVIDNYDSFTYNLVQYLGELGATMRVFRNDEITVAEAVALNPEKVLVSPGPCTPKEAGISCDIIREFGPRIPLFGVCLGHQAIGDVYGGNVIRADRLMHGKTSPIIHDGESVFKGLPSPFDATRYHSLIIERKSIPDCLGVQHKEHPVHGVQFHPESILTVEGKKLLQNFLDL